MQFSLYISILSFYEIIIFQKLNLHIKNYFPSLLTDSREQRINQKSNDTIATT